MEWISLRTRPSPARHGTARHGPARPGHGPHHTRPRQHTMGTDGHTTPARPPTPHSTALQEPLDQATRTRTSTARGPRLHVVSPGTAHASDSDNSRTHGLTHSRRIIDLCVSSRGIPTNGWPRVTPFTGATQPIPVERQRPVMERAPGLIPGRDASGGVYKDTSTERPASRMRSRV